MSSPPNPRGLSRWAPLGTFVLILLLAGFMIWKLAPAGEPSFRGAAVQTTDQLFVSITVTSLNGRTLKGDLRAELLDEDGKLIASKAQAIKQSDRMGVYRFELPAVKQPLD